MSRFVFLCKNDEAFLNDWVSDDAELKYAITDWERCQNPETYAF